MGSSSSRLDSYGNPRKRGSCPKCGQFYHLEQINNGFGVSPTARKVSWKSVYCHGSPIPVNNANGLTSDVYHLRRI